MKNDAGTENDAKAQKTMQASVENDAGAENDAKARKMMQKREKRCKRESESESTAKTMGKRAMQGAKPKQGRDIMHGRRRHVLGPTKCRGRRSKRIWRLKRRCSLLQVLDAATSSVQSWMLG